MARSSIRPATRADVPALSALMAEAGLRASFAPAHVEWKYWQSRLDWPGPRSFVVARGNEILAHAGIVPGAFLSRVEADGAQRISALHVIDWAARPSAMGAGVMLMKYVGQTADALLAVGGSPQTRKLLPHIGFRPVGAVTCSVRSLHPARILTPSAHPIRMLLPRFARSVVWSLAAPSKRPEGWTVRRVDSGELGRVASVLPVPRHDLTVLERSEVLFRHTLACPITAMELYLVEHDGRPRGYFLLAYAMRQARLADCWVDSEDPADWRALIQSAALQARRRHPRAAELAVWGSDAALSQRLSECGFHSRASLPMQVLAPRHPELFSRKFQVQMLDNDAAFINNGRNEFWA